MNGDPTLDRSTPIKNSDLNSSQRFSKNLLKSQLKYLRKVKKLETRIAHAISRRDPTVEQQARQDLEELIVSQLCLGEETQPLILSSTTMAHESHSADPKRAIALHGVALIFRKLLSMRRHCQHQQKDDDDTNNHHTKTRNLLQHMTKGTQTSEMFQDRSTLRGYVRRKFYQRAVLVIDSFRRICTYCSLHNHSSHWIMQNPSIPSHYQRQQKLTMMCWERLAHVQTACSIGCGPGNDIVGLIEFLQIYVSNKQQTNDDISTNVMNVSTKPQLQAVLFLDFAINEWKEAALDDLMEIIVPQKVDKVYFETCDVTNLSSRMSTQESEQHSLPNFDKNNDCIAQFVQHTDIFLTSYLLTETRNKWDAFYVQLVELAPVGALFYFAEPVPWQLHRLIRLSSSSCDDDDINNNISYAPLHQLHFVWIDSSMHYPELQSLDVRIGGPAVLLAIKV